MTPLILHTSGLVAADLDTMTLYVGDCITPGCLVQSHEIRTRADVMRIASSGIGDILTLTAALDMATQMLAAQSVITDACRILAERTEGDAVASEWLEATAWSFIVRSWLVGRLLLPF